MISSTFFVVVAAVLNHFFLSLTHSLCDSVFRVSVKPVS